MGDYETRASACAESTLGYHSWSVGILTCGLESGRETVLGEQFDWGGRIPNRTGGARRFAQAGRKSAGECNGKSKPDCKEDTPSRDESRS